MAKVTMDYKDLMKQAKHFQYIRFVCSDFNGIPKGKPATKHAFHQLKHGMEFYNGSIAMGPANELPLFLEKTDGICAKNGLLLPADDKITPLPWATNGKFSIGEIICELSNAETGESLEMNPRTIARKQLERIQSLGLRIMSAFELECLLLTKTDLQPLGSRLQCMGILPLSTNEEMLYDFEQKIQSSGIQVENIHCEYDPGQIEFTFVPAYGIACADNTFTFKEGFKEFCLNKGYYGTFMTKPIPMESCNGAHFNFSLWTEDKVNAFYDPKCPDKLSQTCMYFIGGVLNHLPALCALCAPTINCYRRLHENCVPTQADWDIDNVEVALRVKNYNKESTYIECRLPSGSSNPYLVTASIIAAGLDGIEKKLVPPPKGTGENPELLPHSLAEAVEALKKDDVLKEQLGERFVNWFLACKDNYEVQRFSSHDMKTIKDKELEMERDEYFYYM